MEKIKTFIALLVIIISILYFLLAKPLLVSPWNADIAKINQIDKLDLTLHDGTKFDSRPIFGIDVSHDQGDVDWQKVAKSGVAFVYLKASDGITWQDPNFVTYVSHIAKQKLPVGPYHFFEPNDDPIKQANNYLTTIKNRPLTLTPMIDVEVTRDQTPDVIRSRLTLFAQTIHNATGCLPVIYSYKDYWETNIGASFNEYPFWLADYNTKMTPPEGVKNLVMWQHSSSGRIPGISVNVDLDILLEGEEALQRLQCDYSKLSDSSVITKSTGGSHE